MIRALEIPGLNPTQVDAPQVSPSVAAAPAEALGSVASAIGSVSDAFAGIAARIQKTENARAESETRQTWLRGWSELQIQLQKEPDPAKHISLTQDWLQQQKNTLDQPGLAPVVRDSLRLQFDDFATRASIAAAEGAAQLNTRRATLVLQQEQEDGVRNMNLAQVERGVKTAVDNGIILPEEGQKILRDSGHAIRRNQLLTQAAQDPASIIDGTRPDDVNDLEWLDIQATARRAQANETANTSAEILDGIVTGNITTPEQIDELTPGLRPAARERLKLELADRASAETRALRASPGYQAATVAKVEEMLRDYTVEADGFDESFVEMATLVRSLPAGPARDELSRRLENARNEQVEVIETTADFHRQALRDMTAQGAFGTGVRREPVAPLLPALANKEALVRRGFTAEQADEIVAAESAPERIARFRELSKARSGIDKSTPAERAFFDTVQKGDEGFFEVTDLAAKEKARRAAGLAKIRLEEWLKLHPNATDEQGREALIRIARETALPGAVDSFLSAPPALDDGMVLPPKPDQ